MGKAAQRTSKTPGHRATLDVRVRFTPSARLASLVVTVGVLAPAGPARAGIALVQQTESYGTGGNTLPFPAPTMAGNTLVVIAFWRGAFGYSPVYDPNNNRYQGVGIRVRDTHGNAFVQLPAAASLYGSAMAALFFATDVVSGPDTVTASLVASPCGPIATSQEVGLALFEYSGVSHVAAIDSAAAESGPQPDASVVAVSPQIAVAAPGEQVLAAFVDDDSSGTITSTPGWVPEAVDPSYYMLAEDLLAADAGVYAASVGLPSNDDLWVSLIVALRPDTDDDGGTFVSDAGPPGDAGVSLARQSTEGFGNGATFSAPLPQPVLQGSLLVAFAYWDGPLAVATVTDTQGNAYGAAPLYGTVDGGPGDAISGQVFFATANASGPDTVTVTTQTMQDVLGLTIVELPGFGPGTTIDSAVGGQAAAATATGTTPMLSVSAAGEPLFAAFVDPSWVGVIFPGPGWERLSCDAEFFSMTEATVAATPGPYAAQALLPYATSSWLGVAVAFKLGDAGASGDGGAPEDGGSTGADGGPTPNPDGARRLAAACGCSSALDAVALWLALLLMVTWGRQRLRAP
jgi:hypothetical protein